jgi:hypothetical protein
MFLGVVETEAGGVFNPRGDAGYYAACQLQERTGKNVYYYKISASGTTTRHWIASGSGYRWALTDPNFGLQKAVDELKLLDPNFGQGTSFDRPDVTIMFNGSNDSGFATGTTPRYNVPGQEYVDNIKQLRNTDLPLIDGVQWFHPEPAVIDELTGSGAIGGQTSYYQPDWSGIRLLEAQTNDSDKVIPSSDLGVELTAPDKVHFNGDPLNYFGLVASDSALVGPIPKLRVRPEDFMPLWDPVFRTDADVNGFNLNNAKSINFAPYDTNVDAVDATARVNIAGGQILAANGQYLRSALQHGGNHQIQGNAPVFSLGGVLYNDMSIEQFRRPSAFTGLYDSITYTQNDNNGTTNRTWAGGLVAPASVLQAYNFFCDPLAVSITITETSIVNSWSGGWTVNDDVILRSRASVRHLNPTIVGTGQVLEDAAVVDHSSGGSTATGRATVVRKANSASEVVPPGDWFLYQMPGQEQPSRLEGNLAHCGEDPFIVEVATTDNTAVFAAQINVPEESIIAGEVRFEQTRVGTESVGYTRIQRFIARRIGSNGNIDILTHDIQPHLGWSTGVDAYTGVFGPAIVFPVQGPVSQTWEHKVYYSYKIMAEGP